MWYQDYNLCQMVIIWYRVVEINQLNYGKSILDFVQRRYKVIVNDNNLGHNEWVKKVITN
jgi:hypothetical protein